MYISKIKINTAIDMMKHYIKYEALLVNTQIRLAIIFPNRISGLLVLKGVRPKLQHVCSLKVKRVISMNDKYEHFYSPLTNL